MTQSPLQVFQLKTSKDYKDYNFLLSSINERNPFYKLELFLNNSLEKQDLNYFIYSTNEVPKIIMLFYSREIVINNQKSEFRDVVSPYGYSGPLISSLASEADIKKFWEAVDLWYHENKIITEFIRFSLNDNKRFYTGNIQPTLKNVKGQILEENEQWVKFDKKVRNNFRKAVANNLTFKIFSKNIKIEELDAFYRIYASTMTRRNAEREFFYSPDYFRKYANHNPENCALAIVYNDNMPISTEFLLLSNDTIYSYLGGTLSEYFKSRPNDFLKVNVINWGRDRKFKYYVLGGGRVDNDALYSYKKSFFSKEDDEIFYTGRKILNAKVYNQLVKQKLIENQSDKTDQVENREDFFPAYRNE